MFSPKEIISHFNYVFVIIRVICLQVVEKSNFNYCLFMKSLLISDNLQCHKFFDLMIKCLNYLPKRSFSKSRHYLKPVQNMIMHHNPEITSFIILTIILIVFWVVVIRTISLVNVVDVLVLLHFNHLLLCQVFFVMDLCLMNTYWKRLQKNED